jgi:DNA-binding transcriptional ArsR family regulator
MPRLAPTELPTRTSVEFVFSPTLDMMNAMYFTRLVIDSDGMEGWPVELRSQMAPDLLAELDFLFSFPNGQPGLLGQLTDLLFSHPRTWDGIPSLVRFIRELPAGVGASGQETGIQGLAFYLACMRAEPEPPMDPDPREALRLKITADGVADVEGTLGVWDRPEELRGRMINLIERFYEEHYKAELPRRRPLLERSVAAHRGISQEEAIAVVRRASGRPDVCLESGICPGPYERLIFAPSLDMGPYMSCADLEGPHPVHGMFYPCEPEFARPYAGSAPEVQQFARVYKALADEQRLRILQIIAEAGELYAQEIVERMGLHQSVVSRHLSFMRAVGLLRVRKQNNMKFYSLNPGITGELSKTLDLFAGAAQREMS